MHKPIIYQSFFLSKISNSLYCLKNINLKALVVLNALNAIQIVYILMDHANTVGII